MRIMLRVPTTRMPPNPKIVVRQGRKISLVGNLQRLENSLVEVISVSNAVLRLRGYCYKVKGWRLTVTHVGLLNGK